MSFPCEGENLARTIETEQRALRELRKALESDHLDTAAIIIEPIQGEGGDNHFRLEFWAELRKLADEFEVRLVTLTLTLTLNPLNQS